MLYLIIEMGLITFHDIGKLTYHRNNEREFVVRGLAYGMAIDT